MSGAVAKLSMRDVIKVWRDRGWDEKAAKALEKSVKAIPEKHVEAIEHALGAIVSTGGESALEVLAHDFSNYLSVVGVSHSDMKNAARLAAMQADWRTHFDARRRRGDAGVHDASEAWKKVFEYAQHETRGEKYYEAVAVTESIELAAFQQMAEHVAAPKNKHLVLSRGGPFGAKQTPRATNKHIVTVIPRASPYSSSPKVPNMSKLISTSAPPTSRTIQKVAALVLIAMFLTYRHIRKSRREGNETVFAKITRIFKRMLRRFTSTTTQPALPPPNNSWPRINSSIKKARCSGKKCRSPSRAVRSM